MARVLFFNSLPRSLTAEVFQEFLGQRGLAIPLDHIDVRSHSDATSARIRVPDVVVATLVHWAINEERLDGRPVVCETPR